MKEEDIKSYSLKVLEDTIEDALGSECRPDEIFNTIKLAAKRNANYHRICARDAQSLVDLLEGVDRTEKVVSINSGIKIDDVDRERFELKSMISDGLVVALDGDIGVDLETQVHDSSEIAFLPPVSGG